MLRIGPFFYIGSTTNLRKRRLQHRMDLERGKHSNAKLQAAYDNNTTLSVFALEFIPRLDNETDQDHRDRLRSSEQGYLDHFAGDLRLCNKSGNARGPETREDVAERWKNPDFRARMKEIASNRPPPTKEHRRRMSEAKKGKKNPNARKVTVTFPDGKTRRFNTTVEAAAFFRVSQQLLDQWLKGISAWPGTGRWTKKENQWIAGYRATLGTKKKGTA